MRKVISLRTSMFWKVSLVIVLAMGGAIEAYAAGEGTIPLRITGRVIGTDAPRFVSNAEAKMDLTQQLTPEAIHCLNGKRARRFLAKGQFNLSGRLQHILAVCVEETGESIELFTEDRASKRIYRIVGKARSATRSSTTERATE